MIKKIFEILCIFLTVQLLVYSLVAFISWKTNPGDWTLDGRFYALMLSGLLSCIAISAYIIFSDDTQNK